MAECPKCNQKLAEAETTCPVCGWPHYGATDGAPEPAAEVGNPAPATEGGDPTPEDPQGPGSAPVPPPAAPGGGSGFHLLLIGGVIGLILGLLIGRSCGGPDPEGPAVAGGRSSEGASRSSSRSTKPEPLRLRELGWRQDSAELCKGTFEVISAPPTVRALEFNVTDAAGKVIGGDKLSAPNGIKAASILELGFEVGDCSKIDKWQVKIADL